MYSTTQQWKQLGGSTTCPYRKGFVVSLFLAELVFLCIQITVVVAVLWLTFHRASDVDDGAQTTTRSASEKVKLNEVCRGGAGGGSLPLSPLAPRTPIVFRKDLA